jgi:hypothetical protein
MELHHSHIMWSDVWYPIRAAKVNCQGTFQYNFIKYFNDEL